MKKKLIVANWKMNPTTLKQAEGIVKRYKDVSNLVVCPPFVFLNSIKLNKVQLGAQNCFWLNEGSFTGEVSPAMLKSIGCKYVILGHFERRSIFKEDNKTINLKVKACLKSNLNVILCISELKQLKKSLDGIERLNKVIIAYEPAWAIGTGKACSTSLAEKKRLLIKELFPSCRVLYGGSVNEDNYLDYNNFDGLLVGELSLKKEFNSIL